MGLFSPSRKGDYVPSKGLTTAQYVMLGALALDAGGRFDPAVVSVGTPVFRICNLRGAADAQVLVTAGILQDWYDNSYTFTKHGAELCRSYALEQVSEAWQVIGR